MAWKAGVSMKITHTASVNPVWTFFAKPQQINWGWRLLSLLICSFFWLLCSINLSTHAMAYCEYFGSCARWWARCLNHVADGLILAMTPYDMRHILTDIDTPPSPTLNAWHLMSGPQGHWWLQRMVRTLKPRQGSLWAYSQRSQIEPNSMGRPRISVGGTGRRPVARGTWLLSALALGGEEVSSSLELLSLRVSLLRAPRGEAFLVPFQTMYCFPMQSRPDHLCWEFEP